MAAVAKMRQERGTAYRDNMQKLGADNTILSWNDVDTALNDMNKVATFKGQVLNPSTEATRNEINKVVGGWKNLKDSEFWTPEGFDALKQRIGDIREGTERAAPKPGWSPTRCITASRKPSSIRCPSTASIWRVTVAPPI